MTTPTDNEAIERVRALVDLATEGPWICPTASAAKYGFPRWEIGHQDGDRLGAVAVVSRKDTPEERQANAEFIALSRVVVPALLSALSSRDEELSTAREEIARKDALIAELVRALREAKDTLSEDLMSLTRHDIFALQESVAAALTRAKEESNG